VLPPSRVENAITETLERVQLLIEWCQGGVPLRMYGLKPRFRIMQPGD